MCRASRARGALYADWFNFFWKNPIDGKIFLVRAFGFDPDAPVFSFADVNASRDKLKEPNTVLVDRRARRFLGMDSAATEAELNGTKVKIVGGFALGPDFQSDGTVIMSDRTFASLLRGPAGDPAAVDVGVVKVKSGDDPAAVQQSLRKALPDTIAVFTKPQLIEFERKFQADVSSAGPIFAMGTIVGFVVGMLISYQVTYTDLSDQLPQYATLKAMGYQIRLSDACGLRAGGVQCLGGVGPGIAAEHPALLRHWPVRAVAAAHDHAGDARQPRPDPGDVPGLGGNRRAAGDHGRPGRGVLMCAALVAERAEAPPVARPAAPEPAVRVHGLNHYYGEGEARNQVLFGNSIEIPAGQLVVMTGPSGAGKTTLLTLIGALRSVHEGRIERARP